MKQPIEKIFISLVRYEITGEELSCDIKNLISAETLPLIYRLSKLHDLAHLIGDALDKSGLLHVDGNYKNKFLKERNLALFRYEQMRFEFDVITAEFEENQIPFTILKGSAIRNLYPAPWLRTSSDIDLLIDAKFIPQLKALFVDKLGYEFKREGDDTYSVFTKLGVHIEIHVDLSRDFKEGNFNSQIHEYLTAYNDSRYAKVLNHEAFYTHMLAHMAKHVIHGGCGVRAFLDIWLINKNWQFDHQKLTEILTKNNLLNFEKAVVDLSNVWFENCSRTPLSLDFEEFILHGGIYGNFENQIAVSKAKSDGKDSGILKKIFLPYSQLKYAYPVLQKHKWLTPIFEVVRWFRIIFKGRAKILSKQIKANKQVTEEQTDKTVNLLKQLGL